MGVDMFFDLRTPEHLLHKLEWEYAQWQGDPLNTYRAWNFFITAEHLPDWIYHQDMPTSGEKAPISSAYSMESHEILDSYTR